MSDYYIFPWLQLSRHFKGEKHWSYEFHWSGSKSWYHNFKRHTATLPFGSFIRTRLTLRLGRYIIAIGGVDLKRYYNTVKIIKVVNKGKLVFEYVEPPVDEPIYEVSEEDVDKAVDNMKKNLWHLNKAYPNNTWRN